MFVLTVSPHIPDWSPAAGFSMPMFGVYVETIYPVLMLQYLPKTKIGLVIYLTNPATGLVIYLTNPATDWE
jgi:hypothetical protein